MPMVDRETITDAVAEGIVAPEQAERLWTFLSERGGKTDDGPAAGRGLRFGFTSALYYLGGILSVGAMALFLKLGWDRFDGWGVLVISALYVAAALLLASRLEARGLVVPMALLATLAVALVPLGVWALERALGIPVGPRPLVAEAAALAAAVVALRRYRAPILVVPVAAALWYTGMDLSVGLLEPGATTGSPADHLFRQWYSVAAGLVMLAAAFRLDLRGRAANAHAFWLQLCGLAAAWGGITVMDPPTLGGTIAYIAMNAGLVLLGAALSRRAFTIFGVVGMAIGLASLGDRFLRNSWLLPVAITLIGVAVVGFGLWWSRNEARLATRLQAALPERLRASIAGRRPAA